MSVNEAQVRWSYGSVCHPISSRFDAKREIPLLDTPKEKKDCKVHLDGYNQLPYLRAILHQGACSNTLEGTLEHHLAEPSVLVHAAVRDECSPGRAGYAGCCNQNRPCHSVINADTQTQLEIKLWLLLSLGWPQPEFHFMGLTVSTYGVNSFTLWGHNFNLWCKPQLSEASPTVCHQHPLVLPQEMHRLQEPLRVMTGLQAAQLGESPYRDLRGREERQKAT